MGLLLTFVLCRQDAFWSASRHPLPAAVSLPKPKPDFAIGFGGTKPALADVRTVSVWSKAFFNAQKAAKAELYLIPRVASSGFLSRQVFSLLRFGKDRSLISQVQDLYYPFFVFEANSSLGSTYAAANQLGGSLSYALGKLRLLRADATARTYEEPLYLFGAVSAGRSWEVYIAYEIDPTDPPFLFPAIEAAMAMCVG